MKEGIAREIILERIQAQASNKAILLSDIYAEMARRGDVHDPHMTDVVQAATKLEQEGILELAEMIPPYARARIIPRFP